MEITLICLVILCFFNMGKTKRCEKRIRDLESFVADVDKAVAEAAPVDAAG